MDRETIAEIFKEFDAMSPEELRVEILKGPDGSFAPLLMEGEFLSARGESYVYEAYGGGGRPKLGAL